MGSEHETSLVTGRSRPAEIVSDPTSIIRSAWAAFHGRDWNEASHRRALLRHNFPDILIGYSAAVATLREAGRVDDADAMAEQTLRRFPMNPRHIANRHGLSRRAVTTPVRSRDGPRFAVPA